MEQKHKDFILNELIPFIQRENGEGFDMGVWAETYDNLPVSLLHRKPACGTVCCIGGSADYLEAKRRGMEFNRIFNYGAHRVDLPWSTGNLLGLTRAQAEILFYRQHLWPIEMSTSDGSPAAEAELACEMLRKVVETEGRCLDLEGVRYLGLGDD